MCFIDVVHRKAVRVTGSAHFQPNSGANKTLTHAFETSWAPYLNHMSGFVVIDIVTASLILSPAYDLGHTAEDLRATNLAKLNALPNP